MSNVVDNRIVEMQFDNRQFERNVATSMSTLDKLKQKLNLSKSAQSLEGLEKAARKVNLSGLSSGIETVQAKFSALQVAGVTALANITNSAVNAGKNIAKALTIDPVMSGFHEYETQIGAIQTILANTQSKGSTLDDVNRALDELNKYADQTIYNFTEMTRNIGTFTAAGVDLDKSVSSIKGIANLAAVSGSTSQQASTAMYQLSQALAAGRVSLMDWNSVVNAGMGGEIFQTALKRTATQMGKNVDALIEKYGSFRESLTQGEWLTTEVLTETLTQLSGAYSEADLIAQGYSESQAKEIAELAKTAVSAATDVKTFTQLFDTLKEAAQSGWTQSWELLIGDFEQSKELLTGISNVVGDFINKSAESRNNLLEGALTSNWDKMIDKINEAGVETDTFNEKVRSVAEDQGVDIDAIVEKYGSLEKAFQSGAVSSDILREAVSNLNSNMLDLTGTLSKGDVSEDVKKIQDALIDAGYELSSDGNFGQATEDAVKKFQEAKGILADGIVGPETVSALNDATGSTKDLTDSVTDLIDGITELGGRELLIDSFKNMFQAVVSPIKAVKSAWDETFPPMTSDQLYGIIEAVNDFSQKLIISESSADKLSRTFKGVFSGVSLLGKGIKAVTAPIGDFIGAGSLSEFANKFLDITANAGDFITTLNEGTTAENFFSLISGTMSKGLNIFSDVLGTAVSGINSFDDAISIVQNGVSKASDFVFKSAAKIGASIKNIFSWVSDNISGGDIFAGLAGGGIFLVAKNIAGVLKKVKSIFGDISDKGGVGEVFGKFGEVLDGVHKSLSSFTTGIKISSLVGIAAAIAILSSSLKTISEIDSGNLTTSLTAMGSMFAMLSVSLEAVTKTLNKNGSKGLLRAGVTLIAMAKAIDTFAGALSDVSQLDLKQIGKGLAALGGGLLELSAALKIINGVKVPIRTSVAILAIAQASKMLADAMGKFSNFSWDEIGRGLTAMGGSLGALVAALSVLSKVGGGGALLGAGGILVAAQSLDEISENLAKLGSLSWDEIKKGLSSMGGALGEFTVALGVLSKVGGFGSLLGGVGILVAVQSLDEIAENLKRLGSLSWDEVGRGLTAMGGALGEFTIALGALSRVGGFGSILGAGSILMAVQSLDEISENLKRLGSMSWEEVGRGLTAMGGALGEVGLIAGSLGKLAGISGLLGGGTILLGVQGLGDLATAFERFGSMQWEEIKRGLVGMGGALTEVGVVSGLLGNLGGLGGLIGGGSILLTVQGLGDLAVAFQKFGSMNWDEIGRGLAAMGGALGETAIGGLLNTFSGLGSISIATIAEPLGALADSVKKWANVTVPDGLGMQLSELAPGIMAFTFGGSGAGAISTVAAPIGTLADSVKKWANVVVPEGLGNQLEALAKGVKSFTFGGFGAGTIETVASPLGTLAGSVQKWSGITVAEGLGEKLESLAKGVKSFTFGSGFSLDGVVDPIGNLADAMKKWSGVTIPEGLGDNLESLSTGVKGFGLGSGFALDGVVEPLGDLASSVQKWSGVVIPEGLGSNLEELAKGAGAFSGFTILGDVEGPLTSIYNGVKKFADISSISESISTSMTFIEQLSSVATGLSDFDSSGISNFNIEELGSKLSSYAGSVAGIDAGAIESSVNVIQQLISTINSMKSVDASGVSQFTSALSSLGSANLSGVTDAFKGSASQFSSVGSDMINSLTSGLKSSSGSASSAATSVVSGMLQSITGKASAFNSAGIAVMTNLVGGVTSQSGGVANAAALCMSAAISQINGWYGSFASSGSYVASGFVNGISSQISAAASAAASMAAAASAAARAHLKIASPSKVFYQIGSFVGQGFVNALRASEADSYKAGEGMADSARSGLSAAVSKIGRVIDGVADLQPTIKPVLDLSSVRSGVGTLNGMLGSGNSMSIMANLSAINTSMNRRRQNGSNADVISAINKLGKSIGNMPRNTTTINGITYDNGSAINEAVETLVRAAKVERRK